MTPKPLFFLILFLVGCASTPPNLQTKLKAEPMASSKELGSETRRDQIVETIHGVEVHDPYRWLENIDDPDVVEWMNRQDDAASAYLGASPQKEALAERFSQLYYVDSIQAPTRRGDYFFYSRRHADREKTVYYVRKGREGEEEVLLDPNTLSEDGTTSVGFVIPSWDGKKVAYSVKENNADEAVMYVMDTATRATSSTDVIPGIKYSRPAWTPDASGFYYVYLPPVEADKIADRPGLAEIRFHELGTDPAKDPTVREALNDPNIFVSPDLSRDGRWLLYFKWHGWRSNDIYIRDLSEENSEFTPIVAGKEFSYYTTIHDKNIYIMTNEDAPRWRVMKAPISNPQRENWKEIVPEFDDGSVIENIQIVGGRLVLTITRDVVSDLRIHDLDGALVRDIELPGVGYSGGMTGLPEDDEAYFSFQSFTQPNRIYQTSIATGTTSLWAEVQVPVDPSPYLVEQVFYNSKDGTRVPMFIVRRHDLKLDGSTPTLLYGYGGFNVTEYPYFRASIYPWLEAGGVYAVANLRGGGEYGKDWHFAGAREHKQNVFDDFIAAAEWLVENKYTLPKKLAIRGGSNGGLLVGAVMTQRPDLFGAVVCAVPLLDMVRYHLFGSGKTWMSEYGNPDVEADFKVLHAYSPYHQLQEGTEYPPFLMLAADSDDRVDPMHARKMIAALQYAQGSDAPALLRIERNAGHGGADLIKTYVERDAETYAFLMHVLGLGADTEEK